MKDKSLESSETFGFCKLDNTSKVVFQNKISKKVCGEKESETCHICSDILLADDEKNEGVFNNKKIQINDTFCNATLLKENEQSSIIFYPKTTTQEHEIFLAAYRLTPREKEIATLLLSGKSNAEIIQSLYISKDTLKTHLSTLYKKIPSLKNYRFE